MTETRRNIPFDRFVAEAISLFKVLLFYLWQPIRRPVWFYETRIEVDHKDTQKFLVEISGIFGLLLALGLRFGSEAEGVPWTFFGYNMFDVIILGDFLIFVMAFFTLLIMASIFSSLELAGLILVGPKNVGVKNYLYYRVVTIISGIFLMMWATMFIAFTRIVLIYLLPLPEEAQSDQVPTMLSILFVFYFVLFFGPTYIVLLKKMGSWWRPLFLFIGWIVYSGFLFNRLPS